MSTVLNSSTRYAFKQSTKSTKSRAGVFASAALFGSIATYLYNSNDNKNNNNNNNNNNNSSFFSKAFFFSSATASASDADYNANNNVREASVAKPQSYYQDVYNTIAQKLVDDDDHDDGSYGPLLLRLAWHNCGSYNQHDNSETKGGSYAGTMRFEKEQKDPENGGLKLGMQFLEPVREKFPDISHGDLYTLGGVVAVQELGGPKIGWRGGRKDLPVEDTPPYHRLPDASQESASYVRGVFSDRLGFTDKEMVVLIGVGHALGRCHTYNSGFDGPWTFSPTLVSNEFFKLLLSEDWKIRNWDGKRQYTDDKTKSLMMLPTDMVLKEDSKFKKYVEEYANDEDKCMKDFADVFSRLLERGVKFSGDKMYFKTLEEQEK